MLEERQMERMQGKEWDDIEGEDGYDEEGSEDGGTRGCELGFSEENDDPLQYGELKWRERGYYRGEGGEGEEEEGEE